MHYMLQAAALLGRRARQAVDPPAGQHSAGHFMGSSGSVKQSGPPRRVKRPMRGKRDD